MQGMVDPAPRPRATAIATEVTMNSLLLIAVLLCWSLRFGIPMGKVTFEGWQDSVEDAAQPITGIILGTRIRATTKAASPKAQKPEPPKPRS
jgi:hypothetical protein